MESVSDYNYDVEAAVRRRRFSTIYDELSRFTPALFWQAVSTSRVPLEVLVRCLRTAVLSGDTQSRNGLLEIVVQRTQASNEQWAEAVLFKVARTTQEHPALAGDLYADLCERMLRALLDPQRAFWEENFWHCLSFERKHVYRSLMMREGYWFDPRVSNTERVPRSQVMRLAAFTEGEDDLTTTSVEALEDERIQSLFHAVELSDMFSVVSRLPNQLKTVVLLIFWEGKSEKEAAQILGVTDRTIRNRLKLALKSLRVVLQKEEPETLYG